MLLPVELVGMNGSKRTYEWSQCYNKSSIKWKIKFPNITRPSKKSIEIWKEFIVWLSDQRIQTIFDFHEFAAFKYKISNDRKTIKAEGNDESIIYQRIENHRKESMYKKSNEPTINEEEYNNAIVEIKASGEAIIHDIIFIHQWPTTNQQNNDNPFNEQITQAIQTNSIKAATDASCKNNQMTGHWRIESEDRSIKLENTLYHKEWGANTIVGAEVITLLELLEVIYKKSKHMHQGSIEIGFDNKKAYKTITSKVVKPTQYAQDGGAAIARIRQIINETQIEIKLTLITHAKRRSVTYQQNPTEHLINICHQRANRMYEMMDQRTQITNIKFHGRYTINIDGALSTNSIKEAIRIEDGKRQEDTYRQRKFPHYHDMIDPDAREAIPINKITPSLTKCVHGFNHFGIRSALINNNEIEESCPRCSTDETWEHVVKCVKTAEFRKEFITNLAKELLAVRQEKVSVNEIFDMLEDILNFLEDDDENEYETNQPMIGMKELFRGHVVKVWKGVDFSQSNYKILNKIVSKHCILYYQKCWKDRNDHYHNEEFQKERAITWKRKIESHVENNERVNVRNFMRQMTIDERHSSSKTILTWIYNMKNVMKKVKTMKTNDIRRYFEL